MDKIEAILFPILRKDLVMQGPRQVLILGDKTIDFNPEFRLFLCTRNSSIIIHPNESSLISVINFTVTINGLEGKLLSIN